MTRPAETKRVSRVNLPATAEERALIQRAAQARGMPAATFARAVALAEARRIVAELDGAVVRPAW